MGTVIDDDGGAGSDPVAVSVNNIAPEVAEITATVDPVDVNIAVSASADFADQGVLDTLTAEGDWGVGNYGFMLSAIDVKLTPSTDVDMFRIKIWDKDNDDTIGYGNQMDAPEHADPATAIAGDSIAIQKAKK